MVTQLPPPPENQATPKTILIVEDETLIALSTKVTLQKYGFTVLIAANGAKAVDIAQHTPELHLILMDINLGSGMDGTEAAQQILAHRDLPIVFLSSHTEWEVVEKTEKITAYGYVVKNFGETVLIASIKMALRLFDAQQHLKQQEAALRQRTVAFEERNKELNCLYGISEFISRHDLALAEILQGIVERIPPAYQYPNVTCARISVDGQTFSSTNFSDTSWKQTSAIVVYDTCLGMLDVCYLEERPARDEGPFLTEERQLINAISERVGKIITRKQAEEALLESEMRYRTLFENSTEAILLTSPDGQVFDANPAACTMFSRTVAEISAAGRSGLIDPSDTRLAPALEERRRTGKFTGELAYLRRNGTPFPVEIVSTIFPDQKGQPRSSIFIRDITARKQAEEQLRDSEAKYRQLFDLESDALFLISKETTAIVDVNQAAAGLYQYRRDELKGMNAIALSAEPDKSRQTISDTSGIVPIRYHRKKDGTIFPVEITFGDFDYANHPMRIAAVRDITERKRAEEALRQSEERFSKAFYTSPVGIIISTLAEGRILDVNPAYCQMTGYTRTELIGKTSLDLNLWIDPGDRARLVTMLRQDGSVRNVEIQIRTHTGRIRLVQNSIEPIELEDRACLFSWAIDITDRKRAEEALRESEQQLRDLNAQKDKFFSILAHDLRNPLVGFLSFADLLENNFDCMDAEERRTLIQHFRTSSETLFALLENLLTWARLQQGQVDYVPMPFSFDHLAARAVILLTPNAEQKQITLMNMTPPIEITASVAMTDTVVRNLIGNALKFTPPGGTVTITATQEGHEIRVSVTDTGIGIPPDKLTQLFRIDGKTQRDGTNGERGTGLGLVLCKEFVEKQGGKIWAESEEGHGTRIMFTLPVSACP
jgi:PAS domain S-box-containing protein